MNEGTILEGPAPRPGVEDDEPYETAERFLEALSPTSDRWTKTGRWIFRGQANANWELKASGVREDDAYERCGVRLPKGHRPAWSVRKDEQVTLLADFARRLDEAGITIPITPPQVIDRQEHSTNAEPPRKTFPLMALAQHHDLPTMLLDWTKRPRFAAYFAAARVAGNEGDPKLGTHLAVWALNEEVAAGAGSVMGVRDDGAREGDFLEVYQAPGGTNPNMRAQAGVFTLLSSTNDTSIEELLARYAATYNVTSPLHRLVLPHGEARRLLRLLYHEGIDGASMYPGTDGVVKAIRETALWNEPTKVMY